MNRRKFLKLSTTAFSTAALFPGCHSGFGRESTLIDKGVYAAMHKSLLPALLERAYPGHFTISAKAQTYGIDNTWPGLDSWQMAGAYLLMGHHQEMLDYFDFVQASQRQDGNIPFAIFRGDKPHEANNSWLRGINYPEDVFTFSPRNRPNLPDDCDITERKWIGLYKHWQLTANPLSVLGPVSYILTAFEIWAATQDFKWLRQKFVSIEKAAQYLYTRLTENGLVGGAGFYMEAPPRHQWDGVTQCYAVFTFNRLASMNSALDRNQEALIWRVRAEKLRAKFSELFWKSNHFAEYLHPEHGLVDSHGLTDVNWAAIGLGVAYPNQAKVLWPVLTAEENFWLGDMPTHVATKLGTFEPWEMPEPVPFKHDKLSFDIAAMGRVWYLEALACLRMKDFTRLRQSVVHVCRMGQKYGGFWYERYPAVSRHKVKPVGTYGYCEYPAILVRIVLGNLHLFPEVQKTKFSSLPATRRHLI